MLLVDFCGHFTMHEGIAPEIPVQWPVNDKFMDFTPLITTMILFPAFHIASAVGVTLPAAFFPSTWRFRMIFIINWILASVCPCHCECLSETSDTDFPPGTSHRIATIYHDDCIGWRFNDGGVVCDHKSVTSTTKSSAPVAIQKSMTSVKILLCSSYKFNVLLCATGRNSCLANCWCPHDGVSIGRRWRIFSILPSNSVWLVN